jgi:serine protease
VCTFVALSHPAALASPTGRWATDKLIIQFDQEGLRRHTTLRPHDTLSDLMVEGEHLRMVRRFNRRGMVVRLPHAVDPARANEIAQTLAKQPGIAAAQPDKRFYPALVPNDPAYFPDADRPGQWNLFEDAAGIRMQDAWDRATGSRAVVIAQLDTGIVDHADLDPQGTRILPGYDFISSIEGNHDNDGRDSDPTDPGDWAESGDTCFDADNPDLNRSSWHGLSVAGVMVAETDNNRGIAGIDHAARLLPLRVLGTCGGSLADVADAIRWAAGLPVPGVPLNPTPARVLNLSLSGGPTACSQEEQAAVDAAVNSGAVVVVAAGNATDDVALYSPANCNNVITVGAVDRAGARASYVNFGEEVDLSAPGGGGGDGILTLYNTGATVPVSDDLAYIAGSSFSAAQVSATAALMLAVDASLTPAEIEQLLRATTRPFPDASCATSTCGAGILDADAALAGAADPASVPPPTADPEQNNDGGGGGCVLGVNSERFDPVWTVLAIAFLWRNRARNRSGCNRPQQAPRRSNTPC